MHVCIFDRIAVDWVQRDYEDITLSYNLCRILCSINFVDFHLSSPLHSIFATVTWHSDRLQEKGSRHEEEDSFRKEVDRMMKWKDTLLPILFFQGGAILRVGMNKHEMQLFNF